MPQRGSLIKMNHLSTFSADTPKRSLSNLRARCLLAMGFVFVVATMLFCPVRSSLVVDIWTPISGKRPNGSLLAWVMRGKDQDRASALVILEMDAEAGVFHPECFGELLKSIGLLKKMEQSLDKMPTARVSPSRQEVRRRDRTVLNAISSKTILREWYDRNPRSFRQQLGAVASKQGDMAALGDWIMAEFERKTAR